MNGKIAQESTVRAALREKFIIYFYPERQLYFTYRLSTYVKYWIFKLKF